MSRLLFQVRYALSKLGRTYNLKQHVSGKQLIKEERFINDVCLNVADRREITRREDKLTEILKSTVYKWRIDQ